MLRFKLTTYVMIASMAVTGIISLDADSIGMHQYERDWDTTPELAKSLRYEVEEDDNGEIYVVENFKK